MNLFYFYFMEAYKAYLFSIIINYKHTTLEEAERDIINDPRFTINRNEEGKIHSRYLGDRYEPAIIYNCVHTEHFYLFDGDIKDCEHPFHVVYESNNIRSIIYYSSERIRKGEPNIISVFSTHYNMYMGKSVLKILDEYESKYVEEKNTFDDFTFVCDEIHESFIFKFAD